ncbi:MULTISPECIES: sugar ABC transporter permease [unclassified Leifsonia]|uniref:sugar ABC transporter permease n=1 Tax=unclassified Leifsonia TaxID=2663824 RepID=UPI00147BF2B0|nr:MULTISPECIES: sugar ABC transporter permease [unclassified Leifsonia]
MATARAGKAYGISGEHAGLKSRIPFPRDIAPYAVFIGLALVWGTFQVLNENFLSPRNLSNLTLQTAVLGTISVGMVMVLILGEIDLSVGAIAGVSAGVLALTSTNFGAPAWVAILAAIAVGAVIGLIQSAAITGIGIPSFIATLAGLLVWQGVQLIIVGSNGQIALTDPFLKAIASTYLSPIAGWTLAVAGIAVMVGWRLASRASRVRGGLTVRSAGSETAIIAAASVLVLVATWLLNGYFGIPVVLVLLIGLVAIMSFVMTMTPFGRHVYAIGGNREAARRAGIRVPLVTISVFVTIAVIAAGAGIVEASREFSASSALGGGTLQLNAIAAAVIGGTSLFGGRGKIYHALIGALVVGSVENGLDLLGQPAAIQSITTGIILALAVSVDAISRRRSAARGGR